MDEIICHSEGGRLDLYLVDCLDRSRSSIKKLISNNSVLVNQKSVKSGYILRKNDRISFQDVAPLQTEGAVLPVDEMLLYEDNHLLVLNKPAGLVVHPGAGVQNETLVDSLLSYTSSLSDCGETDRPGIIHRLDRYTEGLMVVAKTNNVYQHLTQQFKDRTVGKRYYAMVYGDIRDDFLELTFSIDRHPHKRTHMRVVPKGGREAFTEVEVLRRYRSKTFVKVFPKTGRTHQIRVHLSHISHPIVGDPVYGKKRGGGQLLQSYYLSFIHPGSSQRLTFILPPSERLGVG